MRRLLAPLLVASCTHAVRPSEMAVAPPNGPAPLVGAVAADVRTDGVMGLAWTHPTAYKPWAVAGDSVLVLSERAGDIDVIDARSGRARTFPLGENVGSLIDTGGPMAIGTTPSKIVALDPTGGTLWSRGLSRANSVTQIAPLAASVVVLLPVDDSGSSAPRLIALARADGNVLWGVTLPPRSSAGAQLARLGSNAISWTATGDAVHWDVFDEADGHTIGHGDEAGSRIVTRGRKFYVCDEQSSVVRIHASPGESRSIAFTGRCSEMAVDEDAIYSIRSHNADGTGEVAAIATSDGSERWRRVMPVARGALAHGPWILLPSDGGVVRALRKSTGELAWSYGVGARVTLVAHDDRTVLAIGDAGIHALQTMTALPLEKTSEITLSVKSWGCVDRATTSLYVGDVLAQPEGGDRFTASVRGRGRVLVRTNPWADVVPMDGERDREWSYAPVGVDIDGARHSVDIELDNCDED